MNKTIEIPKKLIDDVIIALHIAMTYGEFEEKEALVYIKDTFKILEKTIKEVKHRENAKSIDCYS